MRRKAIERLSKGMQAHEPDSFVEPFIFNTVRYPNHLGSYVLTVGTTGHSGRAR
jgi:hypothetical protein